MSEPTITWARLFDGRLWHIQDAPDATLCGKPLESANDRRVERIATAPPGGGWVCDRCVRTINDAATIAIQVWRGDPRRRPNEWTPTTTDNTKETEN